MTQAQLEALLGRPLTPVEVTNLDLYLEIAYQRLEELTCLNLKSSSEDRTYGIRKEMSTVFTDLFTEIESVKVDGVTVTDFQPRQWDKRNANWYNSIILNMTGKEVTINADWGICSVDLKLLVAKLFALVGTMNTTNGNIKSKRVEDFTITFYDNTVFDQFLLDNSATINKYSICSIGDVQNGDVCTNRIHDDYRI